MDHFLIVAMICSYLRVLTFSLQVLLGAVGGKRLVLVLTLVHTTWLAFQWATVLPLFTIWVEW
jgi:hypothetical protein